MATPVITLKFLNSSNHRRCSNPMVLPPPCNVCNRDGIHNRSTGNGCNHAGHAYAYSVGDIAHMIRIMKLHLGRGLMLAYGEHIAR